MANIQNGDRGRKTLYVTGFNPKTTKKHLLEELFTQGGPVVDIKMFDTHAYVQFQHEESVPYCLALFNEVELHGRKLRLNPRLKCKEAYCYLGYLMKVRKKLMTEYGKIPPPELPPKKSPAKRFAKQESKKRRNRNKPKPKRSKK